MRALVVGRTIDDSRECQRFNLPLHEPAPSTMVFTDYAKFDGDVITCHTVKYGAIAACSAEASTRVIWSALKNPGKVNVALCMNHNPAQVAEDVRDKIVWWPPHDNDYPSFNSGIFAIWYALHSGYDEVYTVGIDSRRILFSDGVYRHGIAKAYAEDMDAGRDVDYRGVEDIWNSTAEDTQMNDAVLQLMREHPEQKIFKASRLSGLPVPVKVPPTKEGKSLAHGGNK